MFTLKFRHRDIAGNDRSNRQYQRKSRENCTHINDNRAVHGWYHFVAEIRLKIIVIKKYL